MAKKSTRKTSVRRRVSARPLGFWQFIRKNFLIIAGLLLLPVTVGAVLSSYGTFSGSSSAASGVRRNVLFTQSECINDIKFDHCNFVYGSVVAYCNCGGGKVDECKNQQQYIQNGYCGNMAPTQSPRQPTYISPTSSQPQSVTTVPTQLPTDDGDGCKLDETRIQNCTNPATNCPGKQYWKCSTRTLRWSDSDWSVCYDNVEDNCPRTSKPPTCNKEGRYDVGGCGQNGCSGDKIFRCTYKQDDSKSDGCGGKDCACETDAGCPSGQGGNPQPTTGGGGGGGGSPQCTFCPYGKCQQCGPGSCKDGTTFQGDDCAPQQSCEQRAIEACGNNKDNVKSYSTAGFDVKKALQNFFGIFGF